MKILVPTDGSPAALRALDLAVRRVEQSGGGDILLLNVQPPIPSSVGDFVGSDTVHGYYREEGEKALGEARRHAEKAGVSFMAESRQGSAAETIAAAARDEGIDEIVMGSRGLGSLSGLVLGSVANRVLHLATVPVTIVK